MGEIKFEADIITVGPNDLSRRLILSLSWYMQQKEERLVEKNGWRHQDS